MENTEPRFLRSRRLWRTSAAGLLLTHALLVMWIGYRNSPNLDEMAHLPAGLLIWQYGRFDLYCVNPPLPRMLAALPVLCAQPSVDWSRLDDNPLSREEFLIGAAFCDANQDRAFWYFALARWGCIPFSLLGGYFCLRWATELYGRAAGILALALWCFSPNVMAWSATIGPDVAAASLGLAACYFFWRWLKTPEWFATLSAGIALGLAELTKTTWVVLFAVWPLICGVWLCARRGQACQQTRSKQALQLTGILAIGLFVLNLGYAFEGTFSRLGDFSFVSRTLAGTDSVVHREVGGNRFAGGALADVPVPLPTSYVQGFDLQKADFENGLRSYLFGQWSDHGWWYYYLVGAALKVPLGTWALLILAIGIRAKDLKSIFRKEPGSTRERGFTMEPRFPKEPRRRPAWLDASALLVPAIVVVVLVSSQTGFSRHFRYVLPAFPFLFIWISRVAGAASRSPHRIGVFLAGALAWSVTSSMWIYPHSMSYFNELAGGPIGAARYLLDSNIDWGQDNLYLKRWCEKHPEATPVQMFWRAFGASSLGAGTAGESSREAESAGQVRLVETFMGERFGLKPGWYAASVHQLHDPGNICHNFLHFPPTARAGYSIYIYHVSHDELDQIRYESGLADSRGEN